MNDTAPEAVSADGPTPGMDAPVVDGVQTRWLDWQEDVVPNLDRSAAERRFAYHVQGRRAWHVRADDGMLTLDDGVLRFRDSDGRLVFEHSVSGVMVEPDPRADLLTLRAGDDHFSILFNPHKDMLALDRSVPRGQRYELELALAAEMRVGVLGALDAWPST